MPTTQRTLLRHPRGCFRKLWNVQLLTTRSFFRLLADVVTQMGDRLHQDDHVGDVETIRGRTTKPPPRRVHIVRPAWWGQSERFVCGLESEKTADIVHEIKLFPWEKPYFFGYRCITVSLKVLDDCAWCAPHVSVCTGFTVDRIV